MPAISKVHDAYIIAVEESARRKLEDASANHCVVPFDLTKPQSRKQEEAVTSFRAEPVTSEVQVEEHKVQPLQHFPPQILHQQQLAVQPKQQQPLFVQELQQQQTPLNQEQLKQEGVPLVEQKPVYVPSMPVAEKKHKKSAGRNDGMNGSVEMLEMNGMMEKERESPRKGKGGKGKKDGRVSKTVSNPDTPLIEDLVGRGGKLAPNGKTSSNNSLNHSAHDFNMYDPDSDPGFDHSGQNSFSDSGPHREMAIDCPDSFIATVKTPPRYPPPAQSSAPSTMPRVPPTTPSKTADSVKDKARTDATLSDVATVMASSQPQPTLEQLERLRKHQEELRKRREEENRQQAEQEFLRASLRGSKKLQALENKRMGHGQASPPTGFVNTAFVDAEEEAELVDDVDGAPMSLQLPQLQQRYLKKNTGVEDLLSSLHHIRSRLNSADNTTSNTTSGSQEVAFLKQLFHNPQFQAAVSMHQMMVDVTSRSPLPRPLGTDSQDLAVDVCNVAAPRGSEPMLKELYSLLSKPLLKNLMKAHDEVAERETRPIIAPSQENELIDYPLMQYGEDSVKIIHLEKTNEHLGATVKNEGDSVIIARIVKGGAAEKSGLLHEGDEILDVNGIDMRGKNVNEVSEILANMSGTITFMIIPGHICVEEPTPKSNEVMHLRAMFNYDPEDDPYIPCRELGISFLKGDILHAIQLTDPNWWQAHREGEEEHHMLAGLIPSRAFQEQRESVKQQLSTEGKENKKRSRVCACGRKERKKRKKKKSLYNGGVGEEAEEILTYEEVTRYYPQPNRKRPIVLVGPPDVGRQELRQRLMESDFDRFAAAVPHTSRPLGVGEQDGKDYHFISRSVFEADILSGKFVEFGEYQNNLYGTSVEAVRQIINHSKICILNLQPESLKMLRNTDLKPYVVFVSPPNMEKLRQLQIAIGKPRPTDDQLKEVIEKGREMEEAYGHLLDYILVNMHIDRTYDELLQEINRIESEPQWVPREWVDNFM